MQNRWFALILTCAISGLIFFSAISVVYYKHLSRQLFAQLQRLQAEQEALQIEWSQLLLEQGTWGSDARVERLATERLKMIIPKPKDVVVIKE